MSDNVSEEAIIELFTQFDLALEDERIQAAQVYLDELTLVLGGDDPEVCYARARVVWALSGEDAAIDELQRLIVECPSHAEAHYDLGCIAESRDELETAVKHFLRVRALDAEGDREHGIGSPAEIDDIERIARGVLDSLPAPFLERMTHVPVLIESRPSRALVEAGFDPRAFGLFEGATDGVRDEPTTTRIVLYAANLLAEFSEPELLREQVEVTVLHEIGHFFGLSEDDLERLGLE
jgi:predicted Zn-dependent protease with MMP-like domain